MDISKAALPPRQPSINPADRAHPLFRVYDAYRTSCACRLIEADGFRDWLGQYERNLLEQRQKIHARYNEFVEWMRDTQGGARTCPAGRFPHNFNYWLEGGRW